MTSFFWSLKLTGNNNAVRDVRDLKTSYKRESSVMFREKERHEKGWCCCEVDLYRTMQINFNCNLLYFN